MYVFVGLGQGEVVCVKQVPFSMCVCGTGSGRCCVCEAGSILYVCLWDWVREKLCV